MIEKRGYYLDQFNRVWFWDGWSNQPVVTLRLDGFDKEEQFYVDDGDPFGLGVVTNIVKYLKPEEYPEYYI